APEPEPDARPRDRPVRVRTDPLGALSFARRRPRSGGRRRRRVPPSGSRGARHGSAGRRRHRARRTASMSRTAVSTTDAPKAGGAYSQGIEAGGFVFCAGQLGIDPSTGQLVEGDVVAQAERALANLRAVLD